MATKTVRLDPKSEEALKRLAKKTGLSASELLRRGLMVLEKGAGPLEERTPFEIYEALELGEGGWSRAGSTEVRDFFRRVPNS